jgi:hypothetical protein
MIIVNGQMFTQSEIVVNWLRSFADCHDTQPDKAEIHLPFGMKRQVWYKYMEECKTNEDLIGVPENKFIQFWNLHCPHIKVRAYHRSELLSGSTYFQNFAYSSFSLQFHYFFSSKIRHLLKMPHD